MPGGHNTDPEVMPGRQNLWDCDGESSPSRALHDICQLPGMLV